MTARGEGKAYKWIMAHKDYPHDDWCLVWPFGRDKHGRGLMGFDGKSYWAHRFMCRLVKGDPPTADHTAAHECGNGHGGCVNPHHLSWKTQAENLEDCRAHGTLVRQHNGNIRKVMPEEIRAIRAARGFQTQAVLAARYGVSEGTISDIWHGRSHNDNSLINHWTKDEDTKLREALDRGMSFSQTAKVVGRSFGATYSRSRRLGLKSQFALK